MAGDNEKLEALRKREAELKARIAKVEARDKAKERTADTREKVLIGSAYKARMKQHPDTRAEVIAVLDEFMKAPKDRAFLKLKGLL